MPANYTSIYDFGLNICMKTLREMMDLIESAQQGVAEGLGTIPKITFAQQTPGSWTRIDILVNGDVKFQAVKTMGPGHWTIHDQDGEVIGSGGNKTQLKASVLNYLSKQGVAEDHLEETTPDALAKIDELTRR
jgi:beta-lactamase superfamily II metal-dependent hydrolase